MSHLRVHPVRGSDDHSDVFRPTAAVYETVPRWTQTTTLSLLLSQRLQLVAIALPSGLTITSITFVAVGATTNPTNQWFALYDSSRNLLRQTVDDTTTAWGGSAAKTLALTSTFPTTYAGLHYLGIMVKADTPPTLSGCGASAVTMGLVPIITGTSTTGLTTTAPNPAAAITAQGGMPYAYVS